MAAPTPPAPAGVMFPNSSLYVGDLDATVDESKLYHLFSQVAPVASVRICRDLNSRVPLGYAYVNFSSPIDASNARDALNFAYVNGKPIRIMFSHRDPILRKSGYANLFIKNLDPAIDTKALYETFSTFGPVLSCKVAVDHHGKSKGYGFVQFDKEESAHNAIKRLNGMLINDRKVYVGFFIRRQERNQAKGSQKFTNVYVKNLSESITDEGLKTVFKKFGKITSAVVMKDANGKSSCFGFVNFESPDSAADAVEYLNGSSLDGKVLYVGKAEKKAEREAELRAQFGQERNSRFEELKRANLYFKNLDDSINDEKLKEMFSEFGTVTSCKLMRDANGLSKGSGFVAFSSPEEATRALNELRWKMIGRKPLYVAVAQRKEEREAWLKAHFAQMRTSGTMSQLSGMSGFHTATPRLPHQQLYIGQFGQGLIPQPPAYGFQRQYVPAVPSNQPQLQELYSYQGLGGRYMTNSQNGINPSMLPQGLKRPIMPLPLDASAVPMGFPISAAPLSGTTLASTLAFVSQGNQHDARGTALPTCGTP